MKPQPNPKDIAAAATIERETRRRRDQIAAATAALAEVLGVDADAVTRALEAAQIGASK